VFGYFFYWTATEGFPPDPLPGPGALWPAIAGALFLGSWALTLLGRRWNRQDRAGAFHAGLLLAVGLAAAGSAALFAGPWLSGMDPTRHAYDATVYVLVVWTVAHTAVGVIMQLYCVARRLAGRMTARHDIDIQNTGLYWHFMTIMAVITVAVIGGFPLVA
jgi:cytochrome c oxidase subunit I+III